MGEKGEKIRITNGKIANATQEKRGLPEIKGAREERRREWEMKNEERIKSKNNSMCNDRNKKKCNNETKANDAMSKKENENDVPVMRASHLSSLRVPNEDE